MSGGGGGSTKTVTENYSPEEAARRARVMAEAEAVYNQTKGDAASIGYPGAKPVPYGASSLEAQQAMLEAARSGQGLLPGITDAMTYGLTGAMDVNNNPYFTGALDAALRPQQQALTQGLQQVGSAAQKSGAYGGARHGVAEGLTTDAAFQSMSDTASKMGSAAYDKGQDTFAKVLAMAPQTLAGMGTPATLMSQVGSQEDSYMQALEQYRADQQQWQLDAPWYPVRNYADIVFGGGGSSSSSTTTGAAQQRSPLMGALGGAAAGAQIGSVVPGVGTAIGAGIGAIVGGFL